MDSQYLKVWKPPPRSAIRRHLSSFGQRELQDTFIFYLLQIFISQTKEDKVDSTDILLSAGAAADRSQHLIGSLWKDK